MFDKDMKPITPGPGLKLLDAMPNVEYKIWDQYLVEATPEQIKSFDVLIVLKPKFTEKTVAGNDQLLAIHRNGVGYDTIDVPAMTRAGVMLTITPEAVRRPMAVAIVTFLLALSTRIFVKDKITRAGKGWEERARHHGIGLVGRTFGSIGVGNIGHEAFKLAKPFDMKHIAYDPFIKQSAVDDVGVKLVDMDTVLNESDFLNISCPLSKATYHLVGEKELKKMKKTAFLINTSRGPVVDEAALTRALKEGWIQGAGIDVLEQEPTPPDNPLLKLDNVILAPHAIGHTDQIFIMMWEIVTKQIAQLSRGEMPNGVINKEVWDSLGFQSKLKKFLQETR
jgi:phosphoglycerate dehydrogenase-like enzyme